MPQIDLLRLSLTGILALVVALLLDWGTARKGLLPPGFREPWRRWSAVFVTALLFWIGVTGSLSAVGQPAVEPDLSNISTPQLFLLHALMVATLLTWFVLGFLGVRPAPAAFSEPAPEPAPVPVVLPDVSPARQFAAQFGFVAQSVPREIGLGLLLGVGAWVTVLAGIMLIGLLLLALGADEMVPKQPPALIPLIASLPIWVKILISLSAGVVEEWFFRGFLQPRMGIILSTLLFVLAHFSYGQPFMLIGITLLSLIYGLLVKWRQNIWPAIAAHMLFDAVQLLVVVPFTLRWIGTQGEKAAALLGFW